MYYFSDYYLMTVNVSDNIESTENTNKNVCQTAVLP